jgi:sugar/nucleoside kinase (ribokinase family)
MLGNLMPSIQKKVLDQMTKRPKLIVLDTMNYWMDHFIEDLKESLKEVDVLTINDEEARQLAQEHSLVKAAKIILSMGPKCLIIKKGEHGALLFNNDEIFFAPALPLEDVFDPTGAGDSFAGGFIGYLAKTNDTFISKYETSSNSWFCYGIFLCREIWNTKINRDKSRRYRCKN